MTNDEISLRDYIDMRWNAHTTVHEHLEAARELAVQDVNRRLDEMNQFRQQIQEERAQFITKAEYDARHRELEAKVDGNKDAVSHRVGILELAKSNMDGRFWMLGAVLTGITLGLNIIFKFWLK